MSRWTEFQAQRWHADQPWICGFNFLPSTAVNFLDMWQAESFDRDTISRELGWAGAIGYNAVRVNLHVLVWQNDRDGLMERLEWFLAEAARQGLRTVPCLFDDCGFGGAEPALGPQPLPVPGVHNSRAVACPGREAVMNRTAWPNYEAYLRDVIGQFRADPRVLFWDLYNEPGNRMIFGADGYSAFDPQMERHSLALMEAAFGWARAESPAQPLTVGGWSTPLPRGGDAPYGTEIDRRALALSDIVTFHAYADTPSVERFIDHLRRLDRPLYCTEWMARPVGSSIATQLALFRRRGVGCFQWGLVKGATQTNLPWPEALVRLHGGIADRSVWFHDVLYPDGSPYDAAEMALIGALAGPRGS